MNKIKEMIELLGEQNRLYKQLQEVQSLLEPIKSKISVLNDSISMSTRVYNFICDKILETYTKDEIEKVEEYRKLLAQANTYVNSTSVYSYNGFKIFDPYNDSWYIYDYEQEGDKIRLLVSCRKNEGSISGLMTFLDTHCTNWFKISELEMLDDGV